MTADTILAVVDFSRARLLGSLDAVEKGNRPDALAWRPAPARAHIAWQAVHCAATLDKYFNVYLSNRPPVNAMVVDQYGGGSVPEDVVPSLAEIRTLLDAGFKDYRAHVAALSPADFARTVVTGNKARSVGESVILLAWHEAHHQGQIHLTWNLFKAAHVL